MTPVSILDITNTALILLLLGMVWLFIHRHINISILRDEIAALTLRLQVHEQSSPCQHCRREHLSTNKTDEMR